MAKYKTELDTTISGSLNRGYSHTDTVRHIIGYNRSAVLKGHDRVEFEICNQVAKYADVPFRALYVVGSAQTGYSYYKQSDFKPKVSDMDLAIIDSNLFRLYCETVFLETQGYTDLTKFPIKYDGKIKRSVDKYFGKQLRKGQFRPDLMPYCKKRSEWFDFFDGLSRDHSDIFGNINCCIYFSEQFFEGKHKSIVEKFLEDKQ